ncbi:MAG: restriction endonuclease subunit S [Bacteroidales bacterium]|nr:restriction endonuclease subunit S [Bacteroidales bacterium]
MTEWKETTLGDICLKITDGAHHSPKEFEGGKPMFSVKNMRDQGFDYNGVKTISEEDYVKLVNSGCQPKIDDILIAKDGSVMKHVFRVKGNVDYVLLSSIAIVRPDITKVNPSYLVYAIKDPSTTDLILNNFVGGSGVPRIVLKDFKKVDLTIPVIQTQKAIAETLSSLDDKIDLLHRQNLTLEQMAETLFRQWFVEEAKEDWEEGVLPDEFNFIMGQSPKGSSFNEEGIGTPMFQGNADFEFRFPKERVFTTEPTRFAQPLDTLISVRAPVGAQNMAEKECCIGRGVAAFRYINKNEYYTYTYFKLRSLMNEIKQFNDEGTVFGSISKGDFETMKIIIPNLEFIRSFENTVKPINDKIIKNCNQIRTLEKMRDTLLPKLMSGEVSIKNN